MRLSDLPASPTFVAKDRRSHGRYTVELDLICKLVGSDEVLPGRTLDISSNGVRFQLQRIFPTGATVEVRVKWPTDIPEHLHLELVLEGRVIRSDGSETAVQASRYAFGRRAMTAIREPRPRRAHCLIV